MHTIPITLAVLALTACTPKPSTLAAKYLDEIHSKDFTTAKNLLCNSAGELFVTSIDAYSLGDFVAKDAQGFAVLEATADIDGEDYLLKVWDTATYADFAISNEALASELGLSAPAPKEEELAKRDKCVSILPVD